MDKAIWIGCSVATGFGLDIDNPNDTAFDSDDLYVNSCHKNISQFKDLEKTNLSFPGASNTDIFTLAIDALASNSDIKYLICAWTSMPRYNFEVGFELYDTSGSLTPYGRVRQHELNNYVVLTESFIRDVCDRFRALHHLQYEIRKLLNYINIIKKVANKKTKIININNFCPWDDNFFTVKENFLPNDLTEFTKKEILNVEHRDDKEIKALYEKQHQQYAKIGGINEESWINLYNNFIANKIDVAYDDLHPGPKSHYIYYQIIKKYFETKI